QALINPLMSFSRLYSCRVPSFLTIISGTSSIRSNVVNRKPHRSHSLRLRMDWPSSIGRESNTFVLLFWQFEHRMLSNPIHYYCRLLSTSGSSLSTYVYNC